MRPDDEPDSDLERIRRNIHYYNEGDLSAIEVVNDVLVNLAALERFDLVEATARLLPEKVRQVLRQAVEKVLRRDHEHRGLFVFGRPSKEWWEKERVNVDRLAGLFKPLLEAAPPASCPPKDS